LSARWVEGSRFKTHALTLSAELKTIRLLVYFCGKKNLCESIYCAPTLQVGGGKPKMQWHFTETMDGV